MYAFSDRLTDELARLDPFSGHLAGVGSPGTPDLSPEATLAQHAALLELRAELESIAANSDADRAAATVARGELNNRIDQIETNAPRRDLNTIASPWQMVRECLNYFTPDPNVGQLEQLATFTASLPGALGGYRQTLSEGLAAGDVVSQRTVQECIRQGHQAAGPDSSLAGVLTGLQQTHGAEAVRDSGIEANLDQLREAYAEATAWLETTYAPQARTEDGVGRSAYDAAVSQFLGTSLDYEETYAWGWELLRQELDELTTACAAIDPDRSVAEVVQAIDDDPAQQAADGHAFVEIIQAQQDAAIATLKDTQFNIDPRLETIVVRLSPPGGSLAAMCIPASEDLSKPGVIQWPLTGRTNIPVAREITTAYHEGVPGHHLQCNFPNTMDQPLSRLHRTWVWTSGLGEGWALYAERLMDDLGALEPNARIGYILAKLTRTFRVVYDIGNHLGFPIPADAPMAPGQPWTFELARQIMADVTFETPAVVESELQRYCSWPAQAISYKIGERKILDWRAKWVNEGHETLAEFHDRVLSIGAPGLDVADQLMEASAP